MRRGLKDIAIVGLACRFPGGADSPESFWSLLLAGTDAVTRVPADRFEQRLFLHPNPGEAGKAYTFAAGTLGDVAGFDAGFFGISPREAAQMDPQQRLLLELTWEALERGGQVPERLAGSPIAVYVGISSTDYADLRQGDPESGDAYFMLGSTLSIAANRISYVFDLRGPSMAVDTACSSSLVALHEAVRALQGGRAPMAVVGGINLLLSPYPFVGFSRASMLAPYGQCRAFDKLAKGYVRAEGGGVVVLKPLAAAEQDGDPIFAVIRGVGVNSDGRTQGISLPSAAMQEALLRQVYKEARIAPRSLSYFEAHGTGTAVGDPIEALAIGRAIGRRRPRSAPLLIGSVKSNIGHLEPASGMAGLVKAVQILRHGEIPPSLHVEEPNPDIGFDRLNLQPARRRMPLPRPEGRAIVGVNSFGFGGANAHVVLEAYQPPPKPTRLPMALPAGGFPLLLSARGEPALRTMAAGVADWLGQPGAPGWRDIAYTAACRRSRHTHRLVLRAADAAAARPLLRAFADGEAPEALTSGEVLSRGARLALMFTGNGSQWRGMAGQLLQQDARFRAGVRRVDEIARPLCGWSILALMEGPAAEVRLDDTMVAQPLLFAIQVGLLDSLRARGLHYGAVVGHSVGEVAAAYAAGALDLDQAVRVILQRSSAQGRTKGQGRMLAVELGAEAAAAAVAGFDGKIEIAAVNSPKSVTLSGELRALTSLSEELAAGNVTYRFLDIDYAFHSRAQDPIRDGLLDGLDGLAPSPTTIPIYSAVTGGVVAGTDLGADYWWRNIREPVRFAEATAAMARDGCQIFLEVGPHPLLQGYLRQVLAPLDLPGQPLASLSRSDDSAAALDRCIDRAFVLGADIAFDRLFDGAGEVVELPAYPWQRERHWFPRTSEAHGANFARFEGPLLGARPVPDLPVWERQVDLALLPFVADHGVGGSAILPAAAFIEIALEASRQLFGEVGADLENLEIRRPLVLEANHSRVLRFSWSAEDHGFRIESRLRLRDDAWSLHALGRLSRPDFASATLPPLVLGAAASPVSAGDHYAFTSRLGFAYGPAFAVVQRVSVEGDAALVELAATDGDPLLADCLLDPTLVDGCLQGVFAILRGRHDGSAPVAYVPSKIGRLRFHRGAGRPTLGEVRLVRRGSRSLIAACRLRDADGMLVAELDDLRLQQIALSTGTQREIPLYRYATTPLRPLEAPAGMPADLRLAAAVIAAAARLPGPDFDLDRLAGGFAIDALIALGTEAAVPDSRRPLLDRLLALAELQPADAGDTAAAWRAAVEQHPDMLAELALLGRAGRRLAATLQDGDADVTPGPVLLEQLLDAAPSFAPASDALAAAVAPIAAAWPTDRRLRVLVFGAGGLAIGRRLLPVLPAGRFDLVLVQADEASALQLSARFAAQTDVRVVCADLLASPVAEGLVEQNFDLVLGVFALRTSADPLAMLQAAVRLAAPAAPVLLAEFAPAAWLDLAFGAAAGAWEPAATVDGSPSPAAPAFAALLQAAGLQVPAVHRLAGALVATAAAPATLSLAQQPTAEPPRRTWLLLADTAEAGLAADLAAALERLGDGVMTINQPGLECADSDLARPETWATIWRAYLAAKGTPAGLVHLAGLADDPQTAAAMVALQQRRCWTLIAALQGLRQCGLEAKPALVLVTGSALADQDLAPTNPAQAPLLGLGRVLQSEAADLPCRIIDLHPEAGGWSSLAGDLAGELALGGEEGEVLLRPGRRFGLRLRKAASDPASAPSPEALEILSTSAGSLEKLTWSQGLRRPPQAGEVEVAIQVAGLNFRDVMFALGALPDEVLEGGFAGPSLGMEAAGTVARVGPGVEGLAPGDAVLCFAPACFASHTVTRSYAVAKLPRGLDAAAAATLPTAFFTVYYALHHLAQLAAGERLLVHGAAGGVGIAALQYARHVGAEVFATVGSDDKRDFVALLGIPDDHILDSRSLAFADQVMGLTGGQGIDVVLNSVAGEAVHRGLATLRPFGRFIELGKADFVANSRLGLRPFRNNITYFGVDADQLIGERPALAAKLFAEMVALFDRGILHPLPYRRFQRDQIVDAFRHMQQSRHIGKIVVEVSTAAIVSESVQSPGRPAIIRADASYLVTGGLAGFGLATAQKLAQMGARHLVLVSRRGEPADAESQAAVAALRADGVEIIARACDIADEAAVRALVGELQAGAKPLRGIVHAAAVFDDGLIDGLTAERLRRVMEPKVAGAWALHRSTEQLPLDFFVLYSSISTVFGNPGQASYVAANAYLESLAGLRRARGLPATVIAWGPIGDAGYLTQHPDIAKSLAGKLGGRPLTAAEALARFALLVTSGDAGGVFADVDWRKLAGILPAPAMAKFRELGAAFAEPGEAGDAIDFAALAGELSPDELRDAVLEVVAQQVGGILRIPPDKLDVRRSIFDLGMDSLMALELRMSIVEKLGIELPTMALTQDIGVLRVAEIIRDQLLGRSGDQLTEAGPADAGDQVQGLFKRHSELVDAAAVEKALENLSGETSAERARLIS